MALKRMVVEFGMGTDLGGTDYTKAAIRAVKDALWHNSLTVADAFGVPGDEMQIEVHIGAGDPDRIDKQAVVETFPYGQAVVTATHGGMDILKEDGKDRTILVNAAVIVSLDLPQDGEAA
ncbi:MAG: Lin0512 family protein [Geminicoccaceae bacterium]